MTPETAPTPARHGFYAIAHRAGNNLHHLEQALEAGVDAIECDFWHDRGRLALRHERKLPALPVLYDKWYLRFSWGELSLRDLLREINFRADLFLDIKSATPRAAKAVLELYHDNASLMPRTLVSSQQWRVLDQLAEAGTSMQMYYSVGRERAIDALIRRAEKAPRASRPAGTSIRHTLLSAEVVERLHGAGLEVFAWTVNTRHRVEELLSFGVDGVISDDVELQAELRRETANGKQQTATNGGEQTTDNRQQDG
ncbi:MAG: glycerophosphodiester phosphodiesterase [Chloroflexi bacterium]|nr:glycerophosphodiester phosphodiesterase [Chloroflexota bacterium]